MARSHDGSWSPSRSALGSASATKRADEPKANALSTCRAAPHSPLIVLVLIPRHLGAGTAGPIRTGGEDPEREDPTRVGPSWESTESTQPEPMSEGASGSGPQVQRRSAFSGARGFSLGNPASSCAGSRKIVELTHPRRGKRLRNRGIACFRRAPVSSVEESRSRALWTRRTCSALIFSFYARLCPRHRAAGSDALAHLHAGDEALSLERDRRRGGRSRPLPVARLDALGLLDAGDEALRLERD